MGSGKSTLGNKLAGVLLNNFYDLDDHISKKENLSIPEIFERHGEDYFRIKEREALSDLMKKDSFIMATGGGTPCFFNNLELMNSAGITVYLRLSDKILFERLKDEAHSRPLLKNYSHKALRKYVSDKLREREPFYLRSGIVVDESEQIPEVIAERIRNYLPGKSFS